MAGTLQYVFTTIFLFSVNLALKQSISASFLHVQNSLFFEHTIEILDLDGCGFLLHTWRTGH